MGWGPKGEALSMILARDVDYYQKIVRAAKREYGVLRRDAPDLAQDFCIYVCERAKNYWYDIDESMIGHKIEGSLNTWLWPNLWAVAQRYRRRERKQRAHSLVMEAGEDFPNEYRPPIAYGKESVLDWVVGKERKEIVWEAVMGLPEKFRKFVFLHCLDGLTYKKIEEITGVLSHTVKYRVRQGLDKLRSKLAGLVD